MPGIYQLYYLALTANIATSLGMAGLLFFKAGRGSGLRPLIFFCLGVAGWTAGHLLINLGEGDLLKAGQALVNLSPVVAASFLHFSISFTGRIFKVVPVYIFASLASVLTVLSGAGEPSAWMGFSHFYQYDASALAVVGITAFIGIVGHINLLSDMNAGARLRHQATAVFIAGGWGLVSASGFLTGIFGLDIFPYPVLLLPGYTLFLVYGILRYEFMDVNLWARKSLEWGIILAAMTLTISLVLTILVRAGLSGVSIWQVWFISLSAFGLAVLVHRPATELATRLVYPGSWIDSDLLKKWQTELDGTESWDDLSSKASDLISLHLGHHVKVNVMTTGSEPADRDPAITCRRTDTGWGHALSGWDNAAPGVVRTVEVFTAILVSSAGRLEQALKIAAKESEMLKERHLAELGRLSAAVGHEMRNPLNIISMASASCDTETKKEIADQLERAGRLINDLLAYSGRMQIEKKSLNLREELDYVLSHYHYNPPRPQGEGRGEVVVETPGLTVVNDASPEISVMADSHRLHQVFFNLLDNAFAVLKDRDGGRIMITAEKVEKWIKITICDNGSGIPEDLRKDIFQPFISGRAGGTGLGLAIVRRIVEAHGGRVELGKREGWGCCFEVYFPEQVPELTR